MGKNTTVEELAKELGDVQIGVLIEQLKLAGVNISKTTDPVTYEQKQKLLQLLKNTINDKPVVKISLKRRSSSVVKVKSASGANSTVSVVRKKRRVYVKQDLEEEQENLVINEDLAATTPTITDNQEDLNLKEANVKQKESKEPNSKLADQDVALVLEQQEHSVQKPIAVDEKVAIDNQKAADSTKEKSIKGAKGSKNKKDKTDPISDEEEKVTKKTKGKVAKDKEALIPTKINLNLLNTNDDDELEEVVARTVERSILTRKVKKVKKEQQIHNMFHNPHAFEKPTAPLKYQVEVPNSITVGELAQKMSTKSAELIKIMMKMGIMATITQSIDQDTACLIVEEMGHTAVLGKSVHVEDTIAISYDSVIESRPPIVTVMGHVDHGKTSLLDYIRNTRVTAKEAGGITQHIGAYQVATNRGTITFLDTPGHSAFSAMRARGANCTDLIVLVVAADDSVMPQTIEAIQHAKAAKVPIIVAINKMDKPDALPDKVINDLSQHGIMPEDWGGDNIFVKISAKTGLGIDDLLEAIMLQAEMLELKAPYVGPAQGLVLESSLDKGKGVVVTLLVQTGILTQGDVILAGLEYGRIRTLKNDQGQTINQAGPSMPVEVLGLSNPPLAGDRFQVVESEKKAKMVATSRQVAHKEDRLSKQQAAKITGFINKMDQSSGSIDVKVINIVLKADVQGSVEAIVDALEKLSTEKVKINVIGKSVGGFNESDVNLALASEAFLLGFNVRAEAQAKNLAKIQGIEFNYYSVIYDLINAVKEVVDGNTAVQVKEKIIGVAEVRDVFKSSKFGTVAGCMVKDGIIKRGNPIRVLRDNVVIYTGELESLRRFKENVNEVRNGVECGIGVKNYNDVKVKDQIEVFEVITATKSPKLQNELKR